MRNSQIDLKICEGCGALWLRAHMLGGVYCKRCKRVMAELPAPRLRVAAKPYVARRLRLVTPGLQSNGGAR